jgi:transposase
MALALSFDLRRRVVAAVEDGVSCRAVAVRFGIAPSTAIKWRQRWRRTGGTEPQRADVWQRRLAWFEAQPELEPEHLVFIDETGAST